MAVKSVHDMDATVTLVLLLQASATTASMSAICKILMVLVTDWSK